jgi:hypothetical protein
MATTDFPQDPRRGRRHRVPGTAPALAALALLFAGPGLTSARAAGDAGLALVGVVVPEGGTSFAVIEDPGEPRPRFYRVGASVKGGRITAILVDRVAIEFDGTETHLRLATPVGGGAAVAHRSPGPRSVEPPAPTTIDVRSPAEPIAQPAYGSITPAPVRRVARSMARDDGGAATGGGGAAGNAAGGGAAGADSTAAARVDFTGFLHSARSRRADVFSADSLRDLLVSVNYSNLSGTHTQRIELYAPDGSLYQKFTGAAGPSTQVRLPVGGTWITEHSLFGNWLVKVYLDRDATPLVSSQFVLNP